MDILKVSDSYSLLNQAYSNLENGVEIRVSRNDGLPFEHVKTYRALRFGIEHPESRYLFMNECPSIIKEAP